MNSLAAALFSPKPLPTVTARLSHLMAVARSRAALAKLDARALDDIGIAAREADDEAKRSFWDAPATWRC